LSLATSPPRMSSISSRGMAFSMVVVASSCFQTFDFNAGFRPAT
jgi:hypothetical protein